MLFKKKPKKGKPIAVRVDICGGDAYLFYKV
jgi:hypothetical protein